jgi:hypothetical protein
MFWRRGQPPEKPILISGSFQSIQAKLFVALEIRRFLRSAMRKNL